MYENLYKEARGYYHIVFKVGNMIWYKNKNKVRMYMLMVS